MMEAIAPDRGPCLIHNEVTITRRRLRDFFRKTYWRVCIRCGEMRRCPHDRYGEWRMIDGGMRQVRYCVHCGEGEFR